MRPEVPFIRAAAVWIAGSGLAVFAFAADRRAAMVAWIFFAVLALTNLFFLVKTVAALVDLMSDQGSKKRTEHPIRVVVFGSLKFLCLGVIGFALWKWPDAHGIGTILGVSTLVAVPLGGGLGTIVMENPVRARQQ